MKKPSQRERVMTTLLALNSLTAWDAIQGLSVCPEASGPPITRLSAIVYTLRHEDGWEIISRDVESPGGASVAEYLLVRIPKDPWWYDRHRGVYKKPENNLF